MKNTKLSEFFGSLSKEELRKFNEFIKSPFFNKSKQVLKFYNALKKLNSSKKKYNKWSFFATVFPGEIYNDQKLRSLESDLVRLGNEFLAYGTYKSSSLQKELNLLREFRKRDMKKNFKHCLGKINKDSQNFFERDWDYYFYMINKKYEEIMFLSDNWKNPIKSHFLEADAYADFFFIMLKLSIANSMNNRRYYTDYERTWWFNPVMRYIQANIKTLSEREKLIYQEYLINRLSVNYDKESFLKYKKFVRSNLLLFSDDNLKYVNSVIELNISKNCLQHGFDTELKKYYSFRKEIIKDGLYEKQKVIFHTEFMNMVLSAIEFNDIKWIEWFYKKYSDKVAAEYKTETLNIALAYILFSKKMYKQVLDKLSKLKYSTSYFYSYMKVLYIKTYYELDETENLIYTIQSFDKFYLRKKKLVGFDLFNVNFIKSVYKLVLANNREDIQDLKQKVTATPALIQKNWILSKIKSLEANIGGR